MADLEMDLVARKVTRGGKKVELTLREFGGTDGVQQISKPGVLL